MGFIEMQYDFSMSDKSSDKVKFLVFLILNCLVGVRPISIGYGHEYFAYEQTAMWFRVMKL